ncbi:MAG TPA: hypothetical protein VGQ56_14035, partial [Gemmatimonadaceae bacterium]|nr:hypothetical protein [Gemmatimonadaceae bacterium]
MAEQVALTTNPSSKRAFADYRRLLVFLRPHWWRMAGNVISNVIAAALNTFVFTLLMPFQNEIFNKDTLISTGGWLGALQRRLINPWVGPTTDRLGTLKVIMIAIVAIVLVKNVFLWLAGQLGASLQEYVTRDLRDRVF